MSITDSASCYQSGLENEPKKRETFYSRNQKINFFFLHVHEDKIKNLN